MTGIPQIKQVEEKTRQAEPLVQPADISGEPLDGIRGTSLLVHQLPAKLPKLPRLELLALDALHQSRVYLKNRFHLIHRRVKLVDRLRPAIGYRQHNQEIDIQHRTGNPSQQIRAPQRDPKHRDQPDKRFPDYAIREYVHTPGELLQQGKVALLLPVAPAENTCHVKALPQSGQSRHLPHRFLPIEYLPLIRQGMEEPISQALAPQGCHRPVDGLKQGTFAKQVQVQAERMGGVYLLRRPVEGAEVVIQAFQFRAIQSHQSLGAKLQGIQLIMPYHQERERNRVSDHDRRQARPILRPKKPQREEHQQHQREPHATQPINPFGVISRTPRIRLYILLIITIYFFHAANINPLFLLKNI